MLNIDGAQGEGGGQILRSALALSLCLQKPFRIIHIRAGRKRPGLLHQHLTAVRAAAQISDAQVVGAEIGSQKLEFLPGPVTGGNYGFAVGTAGSTTLVLQTVLPALMVAGAPSRLILEGGTHNPYAPPFGFLAQAFLPVINRMGPTIRARLLCPGFYPTGGGRIEVGIEPVSRLSTLDLTWRGAIMERRATILISELPHHIAEREAVVLHSKLSWPEGSIQIHRLKAGQGPGNVVSAVIRSEHITEVFTCFGEKGVKAERVATCVVEQVREYLKAGVSVGAYLADQLLLPFALAGGGVFTTLRPTRHSVTNISVITRFLDISVTQSEQQEGIWRISMGG